MNNFEVEMFTELAIQIAQNYLGLPIFVQLFLLVVLMLAIIVWGIVMLARADASNALTRSLELILKHEKHSVKQPLSKTANK